LQQILFRDANDPDTEPKDRAQIARAWKELELLWRIERGLPTVGPMPGQNGKKLKGGKPGNLIALPKAKAEIAPAAEEPKLASGE
jgi:hypothetical protein